MDKTAMTAGKAVYESFMASTESIAWRQAGNRSATTTGLA